MTNMIESNELLIDTLRTTSQPVIHVAFGVDNHYVRGMAVTLISLLENNKDLLFHVHVFSNGLDDTARKMLLTLVAGHSITINLYKYHNEFFDTLPRLGRYGKTIYYRLFIPLILDKSITRVIYLDADILCLGSIKELLDLPLDNYTLCAVNDNKRARKTLCSELGLKKGNYFNSGFLYINIPLWLKRNTSERLIEVLRSRGNYFRFPDQDALNLMLENEVLLLPKKYNYILDIIAHKVSYRPILPANTIFIHYTGKCKPWHSWGTCPSTDIYSSYYKRTPWKLEPLDPPTKYKDMKRFAYVLWFQKRYLGSLVWFTTYFKNKYFSSGSAK